jgi:hypothetical protein
MRDYGKVHTSFWASDTLRRLDADGKLLALYLLTSQHTHQAGVFRLPLAYASHDLGWDSERLRNGFQTLSDAGWLRRCNKTEWVWIVKFGQYNKPDNPNQKKAVEKQESTVPASADFFAEWSGEPLSNGSRNPPSPVPVPVRASKAKKAASKSEETTFAAWVEALAGDDAIRADDPIFAWAGKQGIPGDWIGYAWAAFEDRYAAKDKTQADWRAAFRDHVKRGWLDVWRLDARSGGYVLTTAGEQWRREVSA